MRMKRCKLCGAIIYDDFAGDICDVCSDEQQEETENEDGNEQRPANDKGC